MGKRPWMERVYKDSFENGAAEIAGASVSGLLHEKFLHGDCPILTGAWSATTRLAGSDLPNRFCILR